MKADRDALLTHFDSLVSHARTGSYADASSELNIAIQLLKPVLTSSSVPADLKRKLAYSLETMLIMQEQQDWVGLADVVEYEFVNLLESIG